MPVRLGIRLSAAVMSWLHQHPDHQDHFSEQLSRIASNELTLLDETFPLHHHGLPYMQRFFRFSDIYMAVFEWKHAERRIRVHSIHEIDDLPTAA